MDSGNLKETVGKKMKSQKRHASNKKSRGRGPVERELPMADCTESQERVTAFKNEDIVDGITLLYKHSGHISPVPIS